MLEELLIVLKDLLLVCLVNRLELPVAVYHEMDGFEDQVQRRLAWKIRHEGFTEIKTTFSYFLVKWENGTSIPVKYMYFIFS